MNFFKNFKGRLLIRAIQGTVLTGSLTLTFISAVEIYHTLHINRGSLNSYGMGFLVGNILLFLLSALLGYKLVKSMYMRS